MEKSENWSEYWLDEGASGEVFVDKDGNKHTALARFWKTKIAQLAEQGKIIDLACGAGSVFSDIADIAAYQLHAADLSEVALQQLVKKMPAVNTQVCSADNLPYQSGSFDLVVSQFGIEYAGDRGFTEAARITKSGGHLCVLSHIQDGYIDSKNFVELEGAQLAKELAFIDAAKDLLTALQTNNEVSIKTAMDKFVLVEPQLSQAVAASTTGVHVHLYNGFKQLFSRRQAYELSDMLGWLDGMQQEIDKAIVRLSAMRNAAYSKSQMESVLQQLQSQNMTIQHFGPFILPGHDLPVAWQLEAHKQ